jgi:tetratricopeptide (TPR) repeat protein
MVRQYPLESVRADGWMDELISSAESLARVAHLIGPESLALSVIAGAQILELAMRPSGEVVVSYRARPDGPSQEDALDVFTARMAKACLMIEETDPPLSDEPTAADLRAAIGLRTLLVAPLYDLGIITLIDDGRLRQVEIEVGETRQRVHLNDLRALIRTRVQNLSVVRQKGSSLVPMARFDEAEAASERGDHLAVVTALGPLVAPIAGLSRRPTLRDLGEDDRARIGRGLRSLALSLRALDRAQEAESVLRVAIQWSRDDEEAAATYAALGELLLDAGREGQAIGLLRRAHALSAADELVLPPLALALALRRRAVTAMGVVRAARDVGVRDARLERATALVAERIGPAWDRFEAFLENGFGDDAPLEGSEPPQ